MHKPDPIVHFEIPVDDVERAIKFYKEIFGWRIEKFDMPATGSTGGDPEGNMMGLHQISLKIV